MNAQAHSVLRTATSYLPEAVAGYLLLPRDFADNRPVQKGKTSLVILCDQLDLLAALCGRGGSRYYTTSRPSTYL